MFECGHENVTLDPGDFRECEDCRAYVWRHDQNSVYLVPDMSGRGFELHPATNMTETNWFVGRTIFRTRLNIILDVWPERFAEPVNLFSKGKHECSIATPSRPTDWWPGVRQ